MNMRTAEYTNPPSPPKNDEIHHPDHCTKSKDESYRANARYDFFVVKLSAS